MISAMTSPMDEIAVASHMIERYGAGAAALMEARARDNREAGDDEAAVFWAQVAQAVRALQKNP